jgi:hypothetical protein
MSTATPTYDVFVSHSFRDREFAADVADRLAAEGLQPFCDASIPIGEDASKAIWEALAECRALIMIVSPDSPPDAMGMVELGAAQYPTKTANCLQTYIVTLKYRQIGLVNHRANFRNS